MSFTRRVALVVGLTAVAMLTGASAQQQIQGGVYAKPNPAFPNVFGSYSSRKVQPPNFTNSPRIDQILKDGKLVLSLDDAIALALENNLDLAIARYNLSIADTEILRGGTGDRRVSEPENVRHGERRDHRAEDDPFVQRVPYLVHARTFPVAAHSQPRASNF